MNVYAFIILHQVQSRSCPSPSTWLACSACRCCQSRAGPAWSSLSWRQESKQHAPFYPRPAKPSGHRTVRVAGKNNSKDPNLKWICNVKFSFLSPPIIFSGWDPTLIGQISLPGVICSSLIDGFFWDGIFFNVFEECLHCFFFVIIMSKPQNIQQSVLLLVMYKVTILLFISLWVKAHHVDHEVHLVILSVLEEAGLTVGGQGVLEDILAKKVVYYYFWKNSDTILCSPVPTQSTLLLHSSDTRQHSAPQEWYPLSPLHVGNGPDWGRLHKYFS